MTWRELIYGAFRSAGIYGATEQPDTHETQDALDVMSLILSIWGANRLVANDFETRMIALDAARRNYTIGMGAAADATKVGSALVGASSFTISTAVEFDIPRQVALACTGNESANIFTITGTNFKRQTISERLLGKNAGTVYTDTAFLTVTAITMSSALANTVTAGTASVIYGPTPYNVMFAVHRSASAVDTPLGIIDRQAYMDKSNKAQAATTAAPTKEVFYKRFSNSGMIFLWPVPADATTMLVLDLWEPFAEVTYASLGNEILELPDEYRYALKCRLALELCASYEVKPPDWLVQREGMNERMIKLINALPPGTDKQPPFEIIDQQPARNTR